MNRHFPRGRPKAETDADRCSAPRLTKGRQKETSQRRCPTPAGRRATQAPAGTEHLQVCRHPGSSLGHTHTHTGAGDTLLHAPHPHALDCDERVCELGHNPGQEHFSLRCTVRRRLKN